jgi:hypothetical protein
MVSGDDNGGVTMMVVPEIFYICDIEEDEDKWGVSKRLSYEYNVRIYSYPV